MDGGHKLSFDTHQPLGFKRNNHLSTGSPLVSLDTGFTERTADLQGPRAPRGLSDDWRVL